MDMHMSYSLKSAENTPLLGYKKSTVQLPNERSISNRNNTPVSPQSCRSRNSSVSIINELIESLTHSVNYDPNPQHHTSTPAMKRTLKLTHVILYIVTSATGAGIFVAPTGVTLNVETVGASLVTWTVCGIFSLVLALCYCELAMAFPVAGGDYAYVKNLLGDLPAFMCLWLKVVMLAPLSCTLLAKTASEYIMYEAALQESVVPMILLTVWINLTFAAINIISVRCSAWILTIVTLFKLAAFMMIILGGFAMLYLGKVENFEHSFRGTQYEIGKFALAFVPAFVAFIGWDTVSALVEEMEDPQRDLTRGTVIAMVIVTFINILINVSYFTVINPKEFVASSCVGALFAQRVFPAVAWLIPLFVVISTFGSLSGSYLGFPRYTFAGGQNNQFPHIFSYIHVHRLSPVPAIILQCFLSAILCTIPFFDIGAVLHASGLLLILTVSLGLTSLLSLKKCGYYSPKTFTVPTAVVLLCLCILLAIVLLCILERPVTNGCGCLLLFICIPFYYAGNWIGKTSGYIRCNDNVTRILQKLLMIIPTKLSSSE